MLFILGLYIDLELFLFLRSYKNMCHCFIYMNIVMYRK